MKPSNRRESSGRAQCNEGVRPPVRCLIWDLDETLWNGTLIFGDTPVLKPGVLDVLEILKLRGIHQSIASRNDAMNAIPFLERLGVFRFFAEPQIAWREKSSGVRKISECLGIPLEKTAFIDDTSYEREEVRSALPMVRIYQADDYLNLPHLFDFRE